MPCLSSMTEDWVSPLGRQALCRFDGYAPSDKRTTDVALGRKVSCCSTCCAHYYRANDRASICVGRPQSIDRSDCNPTVQNALRRCSVAYCVRVRACAIDRLPLAGRTSCWASRSNLPPSRRCPLYGGTFMMAAALSPCPCRGRRTR